MNRSVWRRWSLGSFVEIQQDVQVWIDFNDNGTFEVTEEVSPVSGYTTGRTASPTFFNITIPSAAYGG